MTLLIAGDIGGTKTILRLVDVSDAKATDLKTCHENKYPSQEYADLAPMVQAFLAEAIAKGITQTPEQACFAIAGPVVNNTSNLTNLAWSLEGDRLGSELALKGVQLINDFEAVGYGVLGLQASDLCTLQAGEPKPGAPIAVIGAGTGLGQGFLIYQNGDYWVFPSEGGHSDFAPRSELEFQLLKYLLDKHQITRASAERVVSGQGIVAVYQFLRDRQYGQEDPAISAAITTWERQAGLSSKTVDPAAVVAEGAIDGDYLCAKAMEIFVTAYGAEAGNLALKLLPYGGLYVAGGIAAKNLPLMQSGAFLQAFASKGRVSPLLEQVPIHVVLNPQVGLIGAALCAARLISL